MLDFPAFDVRSRKEPRVHGAHDPRPAPAGALSAGIDLGSTGVKMLVIDETGREIVGGQVATPWRVGPGGTTELDAATLLEALAELFAGVDTALAEVTDAPIQAVGIAGMGETGMLVDAAGTAVAPGFAWFDPRGLEQVAAFPAEIHDEFAGRTGLPLGAQVTVAKLAHLRDAGLDLAGLRWLNLPEFVAAALGGDIADEYSLTSRTGLLDQDSGLAWPPMLDALGVTADILPELRGGGLPWGRISDAARTPPRGRGAHRRRTRSSRGRRGGGHARGRRLPRVARHRRGAAAGARRAPRLRGPRPARRPRSSTRCATSCRASTCSSPA